MNHLNIGETINLSIHGLGNTGEGVGYYNGYTIFVDGALPTELVKVRLYESKKNYGRAHLITILEPSIHRVKPACALFGTCGGCQLMHLDYSQQLVVKYQKVVDALQRIGKLKDFPIEVCLPSPSPLNYRNKIQLPVKNSEKGIRIGLYKRASHDLVDVENCEIHCELGEEIYKKTKTLITQSKIQAYDPTTGEGELRHLLIKTSVRQKEVLVILVTNQERNDSLVSLALDIMKSSPFIKGVIHNRNPEENNVILGSSYQLLAGQSFIQEKLADLLFNISPASFFQVNTEQADCLYAKALEFCKLQGDEKILDAYCGVGTISLYFARHVKNVIGVECVSSAIQDAKENARLNSIENVEFICANAEDYIKNLKAIDIVILNPPRKGCEKSFLDGVLRLRPLKIIYISCDPATLARDLSLLCSDGYSIKNIQPYDMFPQTAHVECVVSLELKSLSKEVPKNANFQKIA